MDLTKKSLPNMFVWTTACDTASAELKRWLICTPVLKGPDFDKRFILQNGCVGTRPDGLNPSPFLASY